VDGAGRVDQGVVMTGPARATADAFVPVPGGRIFTRSLGAGPTLIAVHGGPDFDHEYFRPELDTVASGVHLVYYDQRGRGRSFQAVVPQVTVAYEVADLDAVRSAARADRAIVLGHSWGALVALEYAFAHPDRVSSLVLMNPAPIDAAGVEALQAAFGGRRTADEIAAMRALQQDPAYQAGDAALDSAYYRIHFASMVRPDQLDAVVRRLRRSFTPAAVVAARAIESSLYDQTWDLPGYDLAERLTGIDVPTLVIAGADDVIPLSVPRDIARAMPHADLAVLEGCGHFPYLDRPDEIRALVGRLAGRDTGGDGSHDH